MFWHQISNNKWLPTFGVCLAGTRSLGGFVTKVSTSPVLVAIFQMCLARTRTYKRFRDESFHLTGFARKSTSTPIVAILMGKMNVDASFVRDSLLQAHAELAHSSNSHTQDLSRPQVGNMTKLRIGKCQCHANLKIDQCQSTIATAL